MSIELNESDHSAVMTLNNDVDIKGMIASIENDNYKYYTFSNELSERGGSTESLASITSLTIEGSGHYEISNEFRYWSGLKTLDASGAPNISFATSAYGSLHNVLKALDVLKLPSGVPVSLDWWASSTNSKVADVLDLTGWEFTDLDGPDTDFEIETLKLPSSLESIHEDKDGTVSGVFGYGNFLKHVVLAPGTQLKSIGDNVFRSSNTIVEDLTMPYMDDFEISADSHISTLDKITITCAPSSDAEIACLKEALGEESYASKVTNQLHHFQSEAVTVSPDGTLGGATCDICGERFSVTSAELDEASDEYQTLSKSLQGYEVLVAKSVDGNGLVEAIGANHDNPVTFDLYSDIPESYETGMELKALWLLSDGTVIEQPARQMSFNAEPVLNTYGKECPVAYMIVTPAAQQVTVTFDSKGGSTVDSQTVGAGDTISQPANPTRDGYIFAGWFADEGCTQPFDFSTPVSGDTTLYADWDPVTTPVDPGDDDTGNPNDPSGDQNDNADNRQNAGTDDTNTNKSTTNTNAKKATSTSPKTGDTAAAAGAGLAGLAALAALGGTLAYRRRKED